ncbi:hypothetical protein V8C86DRAFT_371685 [Haematococcus lacustris]
MRWVQTVVASDDDKSRCRELRSRVTFTAAGGVAYWVVVEGYDITHCGNPAINVTVSSRATPALLPPPPSPFPTRSQPPSPSPSPPPPQPPPPSPTPLDSSPPPGPPGSCGAPLTMAGLPANGVTIFNPPNTTTCGAADSWSCRDAPDFLYLLPSSNTTRNITVDTCVDGVAAWDTFLFVIPVQPDTCFECTAIRVYNDDGSICGGVRSRVNFEAEGGVAYWVVVEGFQFRHVSRATTSMRTLHMALVAITRCYHYLH